MHKNVRLLSWINFFTDFRPFAPIAILYFASVTNSFALGMSIFSLIQVSSALFEVPTGVISDLIGRKHTLILGSLASVTAVILYAIGGSFFLLAIGAVMEGIARSFFSGNNDALLYDSLAETNNQHSYHTLLGKTSAMFGIASAIAAGMSGFLAAISYPLLLWVSVIPQVILLLLSFRVIEPKVHGQKSGNLYAHFGEAFSLFLTNVKLRNFSIANAFSYALGETGYQFQAAFYATLWPVWAIGLAKMMSSFFSSVSFYFSGALIDRFNALRMIIFGFTYSRLVSILAIVFPTPFSPILMTTSSLNHGTITVSQNSLLQKEFTDSQRATMSSLSSLFGSFIYAIFAFLLGLFADQIGPVSSLLFVHIAMIPVIVLYILLFRRKAHL